MICGTVDYAGVSVAATWPVIYSVIRGSALSMFSVTYKYNIRIERTVFKYLGSKINVNYSERLSSYSTVNTFHLMY